MAAEQDSSPRQSALGSLRKRISPGWLGAVVAFAIIAGVRALGGFMPIELAAFDRLLRLQPAAKLGTSRVGMIRVGEKEFERFGYPINSSVIASALDALTASDARAVGLDIYRSEPSPDQTFAGEGWHALERVIAANPRIVAIERLAEDGEPGFGAPSFISDPRQIGFNDLVVDPSNVIRRAYLIDWDEQEQPAISLALQLAATYMEEDGLGIGADSENPDYIALAGHTIPPVEANDGGYRGVDARGYQLLLDFARASEGFPSADLSDLLDGALPQQWLAGRAVIIGTDSVTVKDDFRTAFEKDAVVKGVTVHAHVLDQLLRIAYGDTPPYRVLSEAKELLWIGLWCLLGTLVALRVERLWLLLALATAGSLSLWAIAYFCLANYLWLPSMPALAAWLTATGLAVAYVAQQQRAEKRQALVFFRRFASRRIADEYWQRREEFMDGGRARPQRLTVTVLLSDLAGYTAAAEKMDPADLMSWINTYMDAMTQVIEAHDGHLDDYAGDGIKANFGVPFPSTSETEVARDARQAAACAIEMGAELERLNARWAAEGLPQGRQRIGLCTGPVVAGSLGSAERLKYTSVGDPVNTAARLEGLAADTGPLALDGELSRVLVADSTWRRIADQVDGEYVGAHRLKGKSELARVYRLPSLASGPSDRKRS